MVLVFFVFLVSLFLTQKPLDICSNNGFLCYAKQNLSKSYYEVFGMIKYKSSYTFQQVAIMH